MRGWRLALTLAVCALGLGLLPTAHAQFKPSPAPGGGAPGGGAPGGGPPAPGGDNTFVFKVCNRSRTDLSVAMLFKIDNNAWRTVGWVNYKPNECAPVKGAFPRNDFYWYAEDGPGNITYAGKDAYGCVHPTNGFNRTITGDYQCAAGEKMVGFTKIDANSIRDGITLTD